MGAIIPRGVFQGFHYQSIFPSVEKQDGAQTRSLIKLLNVHIYINKSYISPREIILKYHSCRQLMNKALYFRNSSCKTGEI